ncbi:MAG: FemAB family PEP-CTERM system-associated protein [Planctomycetes bacterium]|nr:FemAB family PEP-CTERM system-associated protein [Planctomycetota bacterium]MBI3848562.1 FemAB family PEP-CTERM system-associated protein [Planctomycetota bacterium]
MIRVRLLRTDDDARLDAFAASESTSTIFHGSAWRRAVERSFPFESRSLIAEETDAAGATRVVGTLPLFRVKNPFVSPAFVSLPFAVYGGAAGSPDARAALVRESCDAADREGARILELRNRFVPADGFDVRGGYVTFVKDLPEDPARCLESLPRKARAAVRKGMGSELEAIETRDELRDFYHLFAVNKRHLGSPPYPIRLFRNLMAEFGDRAFLLMVRHQGKFVAGVLTFTFRDQIVPYYSGGLPEYEKLQINNFMYLRLMEWGSAHGFKQFDFGRSREGTGSYHFKMHQGFDPTPLPYQIISRNHAAVPDLSPSNPRFSLPMAVWRRLPLPITKLVGPFLVRYFT